MQVNDKLVNEKIKRDSRPPMKETLYTCDIVIGSFLENNLLPLHPDDRLALEELQTRIIAATA